MDPKEIKKLPIQYREMEVTRVIDEEERIVELSFSSETEVERWFGNEILDHNRGSYDLGYLNKGAPLLLNHDRDQQIGVIVQGSAEVRSDKRGYAKVRFSKARFAQEIYNDVKDGIRQLTSTGYRIYEIVREKAQKDGPDTYRIMKWKPLEISIVSMAADITVGIGRQQEGEQYDVKVIDRSQPEETEEPITTRSIESMDPKDKQTQAQDQATGQDQGNRAQATGPSPAEIERIRNEAMQGERQRVNAIETAARQLNMVELGQKAIRDGASLEHFNAQVMESLKQNQVIDTRQTDIGLSENEKKRYSISRAITYMLERDPQKAAFELDVHRALAERLPSDFKPQGVLVPHEILWRPQGERATLTVAGDGSGLVFEEAHPEQFIEALRARAYTIQLGALVLTGLSGNVSIPKETTGATAGWFAAGGTAPDAGTVFGKLQLSTKMIAGFTRYDRFMLLQGLASIDMLIERSLQRALAVGIDKGAIQGSGASGQPTGITNTAGIGSVTGTSLGWAGVLELASDVEGADADLDGLAYLATPTVKALMKQRETASGNGRFIWEGNEMNGAPAMATTNMPAASMLYGAWSQLVIGLWGVTDLFVDPYSQSASGDVVIRAFQGCDIGVRHAGAFSLASSIT